MSKETKEGRTPDYNVKALNKVNGVKGRVGAAWLNDDQSISVVLDPFVQLDSANLLITLFPWSKE